MENVLRFAGVRALKAKMTAPFAFALNGLIHGLRTATDAPATVRGGAGISRLEAAKAEARSAHGRLRDAIDILPQGILFLDAEKRYVLWNKQYETIYEGSVDLFKVGAKFEDQLRTGLARGQYPEAHGREEQWLADRIAKLNNPGKRHEQRLTDGRVILIEEKLTDDGGLIGLRMDITELKEREASFRMLFDANPVAMFLCDRDHGRILSANDAAVQLYGYPYDRLVEMTVRELSDPSGRSEPETIPDTALAGRTYKHVKADGTVIDVALMQRALTHEQKPATLIAAFDISERKRAEARIAHLANYDVLTGLANRSHLKSRMDEALQRLSRRTDRGVIATLLINIDNFTSINEALGHACGDLLLREVADRIAATLSDGDIAARLSGDEFAVLLSNAENVSTVRSRAEALLDAIAAPAVIMGQTTIVQATIGISIGPGDGADPETLLKTASLALQRAKDDARGSFEFFQPAMDDHLKRRRRLELDLRAALQTGALEVHYQPLMHLASGQVAGYEALTRWTHHELGPVSPAEFISIAEEAGFIALLGDYVLRKACADATHWPDNIKIAVNFSPLQFRNADLQTQIEQALLESGLAPHRLEVEITESLMLQRSEHVLAALHALRAAGVSISLDDFGTGYSSLNYLRSFPFDKIKIDRSFISDLGADRNAAAIMRAILSIGTSLGVTITAEGVETETQLAALRAEGCDQVQGYLFGRAMPQAQVLAHLGAVGVLQAA